MATAAKEKHETTTRKRTSKKLDRSVKSAWLDTEKFDLIVNVEHRPCLWNVILDDYKDEQKRNDAWAEIGEALTKTGNKFCKRSLLYPIPC